MKYCIILAALFATPAYAATLSVCDSGTYDVLVRNGDSSRIATVSPNRPIHEMGPTVTFQMEGEDHAVMRVTIPDEEFCIWNGHIYVQRLDTHQTTPSH